MVHVGVDLHKRVSQIAVPVGPAPPPRVRDRGPRLSRCGGPRRVLGAVTEPHAVRRLRAALGLAPEPPPGRPAPAA
jgi:hypothetical protein